MLTGEVLSEGIGGTAPPILAGLPYAFSVLAMLTGAGRRFWPIRSRQPLPDGRWLVDGGEAFRRRPGSHLSEHPWALAAPLGNPSDPCANVFKPPAREQFKSRAAPQCSNSLGIQPTVTLEFDREVDLVSYLHQELGEDIRTQLMKVVDEIVVMDAFSAG